MDKDTITLISPDREEKIVCYKYILDDLKCNEKYTIGKNCIYRSMDNQDIRS